MKSLCLIPAMVPRVAGGRGRKRFLAVVLAALLAFSLVAPRSARAQLNPLGGIAAVFNAVHQTANRILVFINTVMRPELEGVREASEALRAFLHLLQNLWERVVWPLPEIQRARNLAQQLIATFRARLLDLYAIGVNSARLPNAARLESVMRNRQVRDHGRLVSAFEEAFGALPAAIDLHAEERNLIDIDDALAIDQLMTLKMADAAADRALRAAEAIEDEAVETAPGPAAMASAAALIGAVQSQAHLRKMIAGQLRQEAARLAHDAMLLKRGARFTRESRDKLTGLNR